MKKVNNWTGHILDCGCEAMGYEYEDGSEGVEIEICAMHKAAPELVEALEAVVERIPYLESRGIDNAKKNTVALQMVVDALEAVKESP